MTVQELIAQLGISGIAVFGMFVVARAYWQHMESEVLWYRQQLAAHEARLTELEKRVNSIR